MVKTKRFLMYWRRFVRHERIVLPRAMVDKHIRRPVEHLPQSIPAALQRFSPEIHLPATQKDRERMEQALWEGWELMVDGETGEVWIGRREQKIANIAL